MVGHTDVLTGSGLSSPAGAASVTTAAAATLQRKALGAALACMLAIVAIVVEPHVAATAKALADPFFHATSSGAAVALLAMLAVAAVVIGRPQAWAAHPGGGELRRLRVAGSVLMASVSAGTLANLLAHLLHLRALDLPLTVPVYHWAGDVNTYSYLFHSHAGKAALGAVFGELAGVWAPTYDLGGGLGQALPAWVAPVCMATALAAAGATTALLPAVVRRYRNPWVVALLLFCAFNAIKAIFDGGPLTYHFVPVLAALVLLTAHAAGASRRRIAMLAAAAAMALFGYAMLWSALSMPAGSEALMGLVTTLAVITWLAASGARRLAAWQRRLLRWVSGGIVTASVLTSLAETPLTLALPLADGMRATSCELATRVCTERAVAGESAFEVYHRAGDNALKPRRTFIWDQGDAGKNDWNVVVRPIAFAARGSRMTASGEATLRALPLRPLPEASSALVNLQSNALPRLFGQQPGPFTNNNYHVFLHLAAAELRAQGLAEFALVTLRDAHDAQRFGIR